MTTQKRYDALIIGSGQGGSPLATALAGEGWKTALVEEKHVGGTCINEGCTPTKTMVASARSAYMNRRAADYGVGTSGVSVDMVEVRQRKRDMVRSFREGSENRIKNAHGLDLFMGRAKFIDPKSVSVAMNHGNEKTLSAERIFINTGTRSRIPQIRGIESVSFLTSTTIMELDTVPEHLLIVGGRSGQTEPGRSQPG